MMKLRAFFDPYWEALVTLMNPVKARTNSLFVNIILRTLECIPRVVMRQRLGLGVLSWRDVDQEGLCPLYSHL